MSRVLRIGSETLDASALAPAARWLRDGGIVVFPTDTFYGLAVDPTSDDAVAALFSLKGRDPRMATPLVAASIEQVRACGAALNAAAERLAAAFWPGPLSIVVDAPASIAAGVHAGTSSVAVRVPDHAIARLLAHAVGHWITATSANVSGAPPAQTVSALGGIADDSRVFVIDAGATPGGAPSTIVDARGTAPQRIRDGAVPWNRVLESLQE